MCKGKNRTNLQKETCFVKSQLTKENIDSKKLTALSYDFAKRVTQLKLTPAQRRDQKIVDAYFRYSRQARGLWKRIYRSKDQGQKPDRSHFTFANHVSTLRNELAHDITTHPERFTHLLQSLKPKTKKTLTTHAQKFMENLERQARRDRVVKTQDWHTMLDADLHEQGKLQGINAEYTTRHKKVYWDKKLVLKALMPNAEEIISTLIEEERNVKKSNARTAVWGKKNGSVQLHLSGSKEGVINDYERGIHGDLITYYAKRRGIDWYDSLCELAAEARLDPDSAAIKPVLISPEEKSKKQKAILAEQKECAEKRKVAGKIWDESIPIKGTVVEQYLKDKRGMPFDVNQLEVRYHDNAPDEMYVRNGKMQIKTRRPAMIVAFRDCNDTLTGVQCTYLDKETHDKDKSAKIAKRTVGQVWGSAGCIYKGGDAKIVVAEGCETGASLVVAAPDASIYITGGNMQNMGHYAYLAKDDHKKAIHIAADNDLSMESGSWKATSAGAAQLASDGIKPLIAQPDVVSGEKTDFNDVLLHGGSEQVKAQFYPQYSVDPKDNSIAEITLTPIKQKKIAVDQDLFSSYEIENHDRHNLPVKKMADKMLKKNTEKTL